MNDPARGITVNVGVVRGGTKPNVIAEEAYAEVDLRVPTMSDSEELTAKILNLKSRTEGVTVKVIGELNRPPYEKGNAGAALYEHAKTIAAEIGFDLVDTSTGGGSDGNFTAPHTATLDGSASTARARIPITSRCTSPRSSRGRGCCTGCTRRCDDDCPTRYRRPRRAAG